MTEPTEMAGVAEAAETESIYAWALDDGGELEPTSNSQSSPEMFQRTIPAQRLTSRRITALSLAVSLVLIAVAGVVALIVIHDRASVSRVAETVSRPAPPPSPVTVTVQAAPPPVTVPTPTPSAPPTGMPMRQVSCQSCSPTCPPHGSG